MTAIQLISSLFSEPATAPVRQQQEPKPTQSQNLGTLMQLWQARRRADLAEAQVRRLEAENGRLKGYIRRSLPKRSAMVRHVDRAPGRCKGMLPWPAAQGRDWVCFGNKGEPTGHMGGGRRGRRTTWRCAPSGFYSFTPDGATTPLA